MKIKLSAFRAAIATLGLAGLILLAVPISRAQADDQDTGPAPTGDDTANDNTPDAPTRVARISYVDGSVSFQPSGSQDWGNAERNRPMTIGDKIWVDKDGRAELEGGQITIHLDRMTALSFLNFDENTTQIRLTEGTINFRVAELRQDDVYEVDLPNLAFTVKQAGAFRIDVNETGDVSQITVIRGEGVVNANGQSYDIQAGQRATFTGEENPQYSTAAAPGPDQFDNWAMQRDQKEDSSTSAQYVSRDTPGYDDLDDNGTWSETPDYGSVWYPSYVSAGWAPYSWGYWNWVGPWGWTWNDYYPWGFAPFHYGRWNYISGRWGWCPGPRFYRPVYGPAFVGFVGGAHFGVGFGFGGGVGWFPLGWGEPFHPWWHSSARFVTAINVHNTVFRGGFVNRPGFNNFRFAHDTRAVTVTSRSTFVGGGRVNRGQFHVTEASLRGAQVSNRAGFAPNGRSSMFGAASLHGRISTPPARVNSRAVVARSTPAAGASHLAVRNFSNSRNAPNSNVRPGERGFNGNNSAARPTMGRGAGSSVATRGNATISGRQRELAGDKPQFTNRNGGAMSANERGATNNGAAARGNSRVWAAQGNSTDHGRAPAGFGRNDRPEVTGRDNPPQSGRVQGDRPPWARGGNGGGNSARGGSAEFGGRQAPANSVRSGERGGGGVSNGRSYPSQRSYSPPQRSYPSRSYSAPSRNYSAPSRSYSAPSRSYSAPSRSYSAPSRSYSAPSRSYSAPSRGYSGGGGGMRSGGGGGGGSRGGGGGSRSGGGGGSHHH